MESLGKFSLDILRLPCCSLVKANCLISFFRLVGKMLLTTSRGFNSERIRHESSYNIPSTCDTAADFLWSERSRERALVEAIIFYDLASSEVKQHHSRSFTILFIESKS